MKDRAAPAAHSQPSCGPEAATDESGSWKYRVGVAGIAQRAEVEALRRVAYRGAAQFEWNDEATLDWSAADDAGTVLALWDAAGTLLSTTRASVFGRTSQAEEFLEYSLDGIDVPAPMLVLSRVATTPEAARGGLFGWLRFAYLSALSATPLRSVVAVVYEGAPHSVSMRRSGYEFFEPRHSWDTEAQARTRPLLAELAQQRFAHSLQVRSAALAGNAADVRIDTAEIAAALNAQCMRAGQSQ